MMHPLFRCAFSLLVVVTAAACDPSSAGDTAQKGQTQDELTSRRPASHSEHERYTRRNLVSDGFLPAEHVDPNLVNAWGLVHTATSPWWVSDNGTNKTTLYDGDGGVNALVVGIAGGQGGLGSPDGVVANSTTSFRLVIDGGAIPSRFIFASEDGTITAWTRATPTLTHTVVVVDHSSPDPRGGAVYKGLAIASTAMGDRLYASDFRGGRVDVFDGAFMPVMNPGFADSSLPAGYAPFGIRAIGDTVYVTYALQDDAKHDDVKGSHHGFVNAFSTDGTFLRRVASRGKLNSPWGIALAPVQGFGPFSGKLLIGNFGDGHIIGYGVEASAPDGGEGDRERREDDDAEHGAYLGSAHRRITIDGLWGIDFGNGGSAGPSTTLYFAAGPGDERHGLFGRLDFVLGHER